MCPKNWESKKPPSYWQYLWQPPVFNLRPVEAPAAQVACLLVHRALVNLSTEAPFSVKSYRFNQRGIRRNQVASGTDWSFGSIILMFELLMFDISQTLGVRMVNKRRKKKHVYVYVYIYIYTIIHSKLKKLEVWKSKVSSYHFDPSFFKYHQSTSWVPSSLSLHDVPQASMSHQVDYMIAMCCKSLKLMWYENYNI